MKLIIISNRLPVKIKEEAGEYKIVRSEVGWPGMYIDSPEEKKQIDNRLVDLDFHPVHLTPEQIEKYYEGYSNSTLWPLCHYFFSYIEYNSDYWIAYKKVNQLFCRAALRIIEPGDTVWIQDYQLMLLPAMLRGKTTGVSIGYFHHIPFPSYELFRGLPERAEILHGLLGADLIGFHTYDYMRHFISTVYRVLNVDCNLDEIQMEDHMAEVDAFPMGINYDLYRDAILDPVVSKKAKELKSSFGSHKLILAVDRLDYSKGILIRLRSFLGFLEKHPEYHGKVSLVMIVVPSRDTVDLYADLKTKIDEMTGLINGRYSTINWTPVYYFYRSFSFEELTAMYHIADIALVTPLRDGMNLVAKEYLAAKRDQPGVLILSEMAGAAIELSDAIIVNPTDTNEIEEAIQQALEMSVDEQMVLLKKMQNVISKHTVKQWAGDFIQELEDIKARNEKMSRKIVESESLKQIRKRYQQAHKRLLLFDYDGTLSRFYNDPSQARPTKELLALLTDLSADPHNKVVINSGRDKDTLENWFGHLPIGLAAEHGTFYKEEGVWHSRINEIEWDDEILHILEQTISRTPRSKMEVKKTALVWHYRNVDIWLADLRVNQLIRKLISPCTRLNLQIMRGNKVIEIKTADYNKGYEAKRLLAQDSYDFILAIGDDTTDEDMFAALPKDAITVKIGTVSELAKYDLPAQSMTLPFLRGLL